MFSMFPKRIPQGEITMYQKSENLRLFKKIENEQQPLMPDVQNLEHKRFGF